jgi:Leucine-rich repeat (LRR) protein
MGCKMTSSKPAVSRQKPRRRFQFSLRVLLLLMLVAALPLSWIATRRVHTTRERAAIDDIRRLGGQFAFFGRKEWFGWKPPRWLYQMTGGGPRTAVLWFPEPSEFSDAHADLLLRLDPLPQVSLHNTRITDRALNAVAGHDGIERLDLKRTAVTDTGVRHVAGMSRLTSLDLRGTKVTHSGLELVGRMPELKVLELGGHLINDRAIEHLKGLQLVWVGARETAITDESLELLATMPLRHAYFEDSPITDVGMAALARVRSLNILDVSGTRITDAGLAAFEGHGRLSALDAGDTSIGDEGIRHISGVPGLMALRIPNTDVTDEGLRHLVDSKKLNSLDLHGTAVTDEGIARLNGLPNLGTLDVSKTNVKTPGIVKLPGLKNWDLFYRDREGAASCLLSYYP